MPSTTVREPKKQSIKPRAPHKTVELSESMKEYKERKQSVCGGKCTRPEGMVNPLTQFELPKYPGVEEVLIAGLYRPVAEVQLTLHDMGCHVSVQELESWRQPRKRKVAALQAKKQQEMNGLQAKAALAHSSAAVASPSVRAITVVKNGGDMLVSKALM